MKVYIKLGKVG